MPGHYEKKKKVTKILKKHHDNLTPEQKKKLSNKAQANRNLQLLKQQSRGYESQTLYRDASGNAQGQTQRVPALANQGRGQRVGGDVNREAGTSKVKDMKKKKSKSFIQKLFDKLKIKPGSGGGRVGGGMPLTNMDLKRPRKQTKVN
tara:strand:+ start:59 stop:499 length:441 start_codon:yes stop_codon:yes gene_type:complete